MSDVRKEWYELRNALEQGDDESAAEQLRQHPGLLDERNGIGETVLHFLAVENNLPPIEWLHARGAEVNPTNSFGTPLLFEVASLGYRELFSWLLRHGADPKKPNRDGERLEDYLAESDLAEMLALLKENAAPNA